MLLSRELFKSSATTVCFLCICIILLGNGRHFYKLKIKMDAAANTVEGFIASLRESGSVLELLSTIETSNRNHLTSHSLSQALRSSWTLLTSAALQEDTSAATTSSPSAIFSLLNTESTTSESSRESVCSHNPTGSLSPSKNVPQGSSSEFWAQVALDYSWEKLHTGVWKDVALVWRQMYALAALLKALNLSLLGKWEEAMVTVDKGILMGAPILDNSLHTVAKVISKRIYLQAKNMDSKTESKTDQNESTLHCSDVVTGGGDNRQRYPRKTIGKIKFRNYTPSSLGENTVSDSQVKLAPPPPTQHVPLMTQHMPLVDMMKRIPVVYCPSLTHFYWDHMIPEVPVVISGVMDHWPAYAEKKWKYVG